jgi:1-acyl-sn-glycerol-3-phosphate acyltransferase
MWLRTISSGNCISIYVTSTCRADIAQIGLFNHTSWVDAIAIMYLFAPSGVSKESNARLPIVGVCIRSFQNIYVSRSSIEGDKHRNGAERVSEKIAKRCVARAVAVNLSPDAFWEHMRQDSCTRCQERCKWRQAVELTQALVA